MSFNPTPPIKPFPPRAASVEPGFERLEPILTIERLKDEYLFGVPLTSTLTGETMKDSALKKFITRAISKIEHEARISISPVKYTERTDYTLADYTKHAWVQLDHWPIIQVESFKAKYPHLVDSDLQFPEEWISLYNEFGIMQLVPTSGSISQFLITTDASLLPIVLGGRGAWPQLWETTYVAGFEKDAIPAIINDLIGTHAAMRVLQQIDSVFYTGGYGIGIDGVSQNVSLPGPGWLAGRIAALKEEYAQMIDTVKRYYQKQMQISSLG